MLLYRSFSIIDYESRCEKEMSEKVNVLLPKKVPILWNEMKLES